MHLSMQIEYIESPSTIPHANNVKRYSFCCGKYMQMTSSVISLTFISRMGFIWYFFLCRAIYSFGNGIFICNQNSSCQIVDSMCSMLRLQNILSSQTLDCRCCSLGNEWKICFVLQAYLFVDENGSCQFLVQTIFIHRFKTKKQMTKRQNSH